MPYYIRVLGLNSVPVPIAEIEEAANPAKVEALKSDDCSWCELLLRHDSGEEIAIIEKNPVIEGELGHDEIREFREEIQDCKPESGSRWLRDYLSKIQVIYAFQLLDGTDVHDGWSALGRVKRAIWDSVGGIIQADREGFSNESGYTIVWQFSESVTGDWHMGILHPKQGWIHFKMDLGNEDHRRAFLAGEVPNGVEPIEAT